MHKTQTQMCTNMSAFSYLEMFFFGVWEGGKTEILVKFKQNLKVLFNKTQIV